jgi:hypothetical protein
VCRVVPYIAGHVIAVMYVIAAWRWPRAAGFITGVGFVFAGGFNIWTACTSPGTYVQAFGPHALAPYRAFIYGAFARCGSMAPPHRIGGSAESPRRFSGRLESGRGVANPDAGISPNTSV